MSLTTSELTPADLSCICNNDKNDGLFGGDGLYAIIVLFILMGMMGGCGFGGFGGFGGNNLASDSAVMYPWMNQLEATRQGFADQNNTMAIANLANAVNSGFGDTALGMAGINQNICQTGNGIAAAINGGFANAETAATARQMANMNTAFAAQTAMSQGFNSLGTQFADCCCEQRLANCQTQNTIQNEGNATRFADANNTRDIIQSQTAGTQAILDKLCQLELDGVKAQVDAKNDRISELTTQLNMANLNASQTAQTAQILAGQAAEVDGVYNRLKNCPVPSMPVYGNQPIFSCPSGFGCGCNG